MVRKKIVSGQSCIFVTTEVPLLIYRSKEPESSRRAHEPEAEDDYLRAIKLQLQHNRLCF